MKTLRLIKNEKIIFVFWSLIWKGINHTKNALNWQSGRLQLVSTFFLLYHNFKLSIYFALP